MKSERIYKNNKDYKLDINPTNTFVKVDSPVFKKPISISLDKIGEVLAIRVPDISVNTSNISSVSFIRQDVNPSLNPQKIPISPHTYFSVDSNYLYVWVPQISKWKRMLLSDW